MRVTAELELALTLICHALVNVVVLLAKQFQPLEAVGKLIVQALGGVPLPTVTRNAAVPLFADTDGLPDPQLLTVGAVEETSRCALGPTAKLAEPVTVEPDTAAGIVPPIAGGEAR